MKWSHTLMLGGALVVLTNAVVLGGASYNRNGEPESRLHLSQRELQPEHWRRDKDDSGLDLQLDWRIARQDDGEGDGYDGNWGDPLWLDKAKMAELGFDVAAIARSAEHPRGRSEQSREVLLVLEFNHEAWQQSLRQAEAYAELARKLLKQNPGKKEFIDRGKQAEQRLEQERNKSSRLFVIDAGLDAASLRIAYPDRSRYAIVRGRIDPDVVRNEDACKESRVSGRVTEVYSAEINVPLEYRKMFEHEAPFDLDIVFGKRLEPWIAGAGKAADGQ